MDRSDVSEDEGASEKDFAQYHLHIPLALLGVALLVASVATYLFHPQIVPSLPFP
jgi:hypothetical protein